MLSILPEMPGELTTIPLGSINAMLVAKPECRRLKQLSLGRQAYLRVLRERLSWRIICMQGNGLLEVRRGGYSVEQRFLWGQNCGWFVSIKVRLHGTVIG
jgi:hypothetical protein